jgi:hypothetical protein
MWDRIKRGGPTLSDIEDISLLIVLFLIMMFSLLAQFFPQLNIFFSNYLTLIYITILFTARIIYKKIDEVHSLMFLRFPTRDFNALTRQIFERHPKSKTIDLFAYDGTKFFHAIEDLKFGTEEIRILLYKNSPDLKKILDLWERFNNIGSCRKLIIRTYEFNPSFYYISIDKNEGYFGFFNPAYVVSPGKGRIPFDSYLQVQITGPYPLARTSPIEGAILEDLRIWFDDVFDCHSEPLFIIPPEKHE